MFDSVFQLSSAVSRAITPENPTGEPGGACRARPDDPDPLAPSAAEAAADLGEGWKVSPHATLAGNGELTLGAIEGPGVIRHIWLTLDQALFLDCCVLQIRYAGESEPSVSVPIGAFFATGNPPVPNGGVAFTTGNRGGLNCYLPMPFAESIELTLVNNASTPAIVYWAIDYTLEPVAASAAPLQASYRRSDPVDDGGIHVLIDHVDGPGKYIGTFVTWDQHTPGWWGEGEMKFYLDGDRDYPTITSTGAEDYFGGAWNFIEGQFAGPFCGFVTIAGKNEVDGGRHAMYRWHLPDPVHFHDELRVTLQSLGWGPDRRYRIRQDTVSSVAYWYGRPEQA